MIDAWDADNAAEGDATVAAPPKAGKREQAMQDAQRAVDDGLAFFSDKLQHSHTFADITKQILETAKKAILEHMTEKVFNMMVNPKLPLEQQEAGKEMQVSLSSLSADFDIALYGGEFFDACRQVDKPTSDFNFVPMSIRTLVEALSGRLTVNADVFMEAGAKRFVFGCLVEDDRIRILFTLDTEGDADDLQLSVRCVLGSRIDSQRTVLLGIVADLLHGKGNATKLLLLVEVCVGARHDFFKDKMLDTIMRVEMPILTAPDNFDDGSAQRCAVALRDPFHALHVPCTQARVFQWAHALRADPIINNK